MVLSAKVKSTQPWEKITDYDLGNIAFRWRMPGESLRSDLLTFPALLKNLSHFTGFLLGL